MGEACRVRISGATPGLIADESILTVGAGNGKNTVFSRDVDDKKYG
jgi:hypothetical protein